MDNIAKMEKARSVFGTVCRALDNREWNYKKDEEALKIECGARGEDLPMELTINVDADRMVVLVLSHIPFIIPEDKRLDAAIAVAAVNNRLVDGCFDYDIKSGHLFFRLTNSYMDSMIGEDVFFYMVLCSCQTIDEFNDKIFMLAKGMLSMEQFLAAINK